MQKNHSQKKKNQSKVSSRSKTPSNKGIYIHPSRVKRYVDVYGLNSHIENAVAELRAAEPHAVVNADKTTSTSALVKFTDLSEATRSLVAKAKELAVEREVEARKRASAKAGQTQPATAAPLKKLEKPAPAKAPSPYQNEISLLSKMRVRFSKESPLYLSATLCHALHELFEHGMNNAMLDDKKIFRVRHCLLNSGKLNMSCLYTSLPAWKTQLDLETQRLADEAKRAEELRLKKEEEKRLAKEAHQQALVGQAPADAKPAQVVAQPAAVPQDDAQDDDHSEESNDIRDFSHYVRQVCYDVVNQRVATWHLTNKEAHPFENMRVSRDVCEFGSQLIIDYIHRMCPLLLNQLNAIRVRTIGSHVTRQLVHFHLGMFGVDTQVVDKAVQAKVQAYQAWSKARQEEKRLLAEAKKPTATQAAAPAK